jgi:hypothetical protein
MQLSPQNGINKLYELNHTSYVYFTNDARSFVPESNGVVSTATKMLELPILLGLEMTGMHGIIRNKVTLYFSFTIIKRRIELQ